MRTILLLLMTSLAALVSASESNPRLQRALDGFDSSVASAQQDREAAIQAANEAYAQAIARAQERALRDIKRLISSRTDAATTAILYRQVLTLDYTDADAREFFTAIGTLDQVLDNLEPRVETDLLGNVVGGTPIGKESTMYIRADDRFTLWLNGEMVGRGDIWDRVYQFSLTLKRGDVLAIEATDYQNGFGSCGMALAIVDEDNNILLDSRNFLVATSVPDGWQSGRVSVAWEEPNQNGVHPLLQQPQLGPVTGHGVWAPQESKTVYFIHAIR